MITSEFEKQMRSQINAIKGAYMAGKKSKKDAINELKGLKKELDHHEEERMKIEIIEITQRKCLYNIQSYINVGMKFVVIGRDKLKDGSEVLLLSNGNNPHVKGDVIRCNSNRFSWKPVTLEDIKEESIMRETNLFVKEVDKNFTKKEQFQISLVPYMILEFAWEYTDKALKFAADNRISELKKLTRAVRLLKEKYYEKHLKVFNAKQAEILKYNSKLFVEENARNFLIMYITFKNEVDKIAPNDPYTDMRVNALMSKLLCEFYIEYLYKINRMIRGRTGIDFDQKVDKYIDALITAMDAFVPDYMQINTSGNIDLCFKILNNNLNKIDFNTK